MELQVITEASPEVLSAIIVSGELPYGITVAGIENDPDFDSYFRYRNDFKLLAGKIMSIKYPESKAKPTSSISQEDRAKKMMLEHRKLDIEENKLEQVEKKTTLATNIQRFSSNFTRMFTRIDRLIRISDANNKSLQEIKKLLEEKK